MFQAEPKRCTTRYCRYDPVPGGPAACLVKRGFLLHAARKSPLLQCQIRTILWPRGGKQTYPGFSNVELGRL